jgi:hypothetical protein
LAAEGVERAASELERGRCKAGTSPEITAQSLVLLLVETLLLRHQPQVFLLSIASSIWALVIVLNLFFLVPINNRLARLESSAAVNKALIDHRKWDALHRLRVAGPDRGDGSVPDCDPIVRSSAELFA